MKTAHQKLGLVLFLFFSSITLVFSNTSKEQLVELAKKQRVLSQKIAKSYLLLAYGANLQEIKTELKTSISKFDNNLNILRAEAPKYFTTVANNVLNKEASVWYNLKVNVERKPTTENFNRIVELAHVLLKKSHLAYTALKTEVEVKNNYYTVDNNLTDLLKISEKQEITSERLCLYFVAQKINVVAPVSNPKILGTLRTIVSKLDNQLNVLLETNVNSKETTKIITDALIAFEDIRTNKTDFLDGKPSMNTIYTTTKELNRLFEILSNEYNQLATL